MRKLKLLGILILILAISLIFVSCSDMKEIGFQENEDLKIIFSYNYDNDTNIVVKNISDKIILEYEVAYMEFDKNGLSTDDYKKGIMEAANLLPDDKAIGNWYGANGKYVVAIIKNVKYKGGEEWNAVGVDEYFSNLEKNFNIEEYEKNFKNKVEGNGVLAQENEFLKINYTYITHDNEFSLNKDYHYYVENISDKTILEFGIIVAEFDENGLPIRTSPYDHFSRNSRGIGGIANLASGEGQEFYNDLFLEPNCENTKCIVSYIKFYNGYEWENPYIYEWIYLNSGELDSY